MVIPSSLDATLAPPGAHVCLLFTQFTPYTLAGGRVWDTMVKEEYAQKVSLGENFFFISIHNNFKFNVSVNGWTRYYYSYHLCEWKHKFTLGDIG